MKLEMNRIKEVGKKTLSEFVRSETGSVGVKNAATIGAFAAAFAISQTSSEGVLSTGPDGIGTWAI